MPLVSWTLSFLRPYRARVAAIAILALTEIGLAALSPWPLKIVVDSVLGGHPVPDWFAVLIPSRVGASAVALLVIVVVAGLLLQIAHELVRMIDTQLQVDTGQRIVYNLRAKLLEHLQALPLRHHILTRTADSVYRLDADAHCVNDLAIGGVFPLALAVVNLVVMFVILVYLDLTLGLLSLTVVPFLYLCLRYYSRTMIDRAERVKELESTLIDRAFEILSSVAVIKSFARERYELARFSRSGDEAMHARLRLTWQESLFSVAVTAITLAGTALVLIVGGLHVLDSTLTVGSLLVVIAYLAAVYNPMSAIAHTTGSLQQAAVSARRVREVFALTPERLDGPDTLDASEVEGRVRFESVGFSYGDDRRVLEDVSFEVRPGEMFAIVGVTGAGKTTIANLIPRFFEPKSGRVLVDEVDVRRYSLRSLRERIAVVPQQPVLFSGTIADNIRYGRLEASDQEIEAAARAAYVHEFIQQLPQGYQTPVAEAGATLSGGERQRLGLARALLKNAPILLLDEPTSSLDALSEAAVFGALRRLRKGRTTIVIAHRLSTIRDATRILVLHEGWLIDQGTHDELMASNDLYRRMCARLSVGRSLDEPETFDELMQVIP
ncbi:MAG TPA: ABC transporter ATP-binding protein [Vicinamibacterales bacterium]|nr:ABC transporter ATP-binding protein [Vicinamibacterales bacterium]